MAYQPQRSQGQQGRSGYQGGGQNRSPAHGQGGGRGTGGQPPPRDISRPAAYLGEGGAKRPALFDGEAREEAQLWADSGIKTAQLRRFFGATMAHLRRIDLGQSDDLDTQAAMALMKASATYAAARRKESRDADHGPIRDFFEHHARLVKTQNDFRLFATHFEVVVAYNKAMEKKHGGGYGDRD
jgi:CRISPR type III-A-associated protein Csm2